MFYHYLIFILFTSIHAFFFFLHTFYHYLIFLQIWDFLVAVSSSETASVANYFYIPLFPCVREACQWANAGQTS